MLAWLGCIRISVVGDYESLALEFLKFMQSSSFISRILENFSITPVDEIPVVEYLKAIGRKIGALLPGGEVDISRAGKFLLENFATGKLGAFTLELP